jgi:hypothetical protein
VKRVCSELEINVRLVCITLGLEHATFEVLINPRRENGKYKMAC